MSVIIKNYSSIQIFNSKWEREIGDTLYIDDVPFDVIFVGTDQECELIFTMLKKIQSQQRYKRRKLQKIEDRIWYKKIVLESIDSLNETIPEEYHIKFSDVKELINI